MRLAPEGVPFVAGAALVLLGLVALGILAGGWAWTPAALWAPIAIWVPWFFRYPDRDGPRGAHLVIAPADGKIVSVADVDEPTFLKGPARRISIFMNVFDVHVNAHPVSGTVRQREYRPGAFVNATLDKASEDNERMSLGVETPRGRVLVRQIAGLIARRIVTDAQVGEAVTQGTRLGIIRFGSRVDTFVPRDVSVHVKEGQRARAGITLLGEWPS